ncbi:MAG: large subunit ribosomal protein [Planctomycetota bacterium]|nr:MAG: large subunit ribosomal protein [Planctomycetota bacterium]
MKIAEIRQKSTDELKTQVKKIYEEHFNLRFRRVTDVIENPQALRELRRELARIHTVVRQREMEEAIKAPAKPAVPAPTNEPVKASAKAEAKAPVKAPARAPAKAKEKKVVAKAAKKDK